MELLSLHSPLISALPSPRLVFSERPSFLSGQILPLTQTRAHPQVKIVRIFRYKARVSGSVVGTTESSLGTVKAVTQEIQQKDDNLVFVAGSTGRVGSRAVRELLKLGFRVRAAVRSKQKAESLAASVLQMRVEGGVQPIEKLEIVECDLENQEEIAPAIGNASVVLCCIGASEKEVFDITGPYRIDYLATKNLIDAAKVAKVKHFVLLTSLGTNKIGFPAAILNLFWGVLIWKRKAEESLLASGLPYTIVRPGGMERPTDTYKETHNMVLSNEDTLFGGQVSNLQVAELMAYMAKNRKLSFCKVVEVVAETTAPLTPMGDLLVKIPSQRVDSSISEELKSKSNDTEPSPAPIQEAPSPPVEKEPIQTETQKPRPLSPYTVYDDLKPPTSPSPTQSTAIGVTKESAADIGKTVVGSQAPFSSSGQIFKFTEIPPADKLENKQSHQPKSRPLSPFTMYEDLKPPRSPQASSK